MKKFLSGMDLIVNLCCSPDDLDLPSYGPDPGNFQGGIYDGMVWQFPIRDRKAPTKECEKAFAVFVSGVADVMKTDRKKVYVHCRGGHGRSGLFVGCLLAVLRPELSIEDIFERLARYHSNRKTMSDRMRKLGCPQTRVQKEYVDEFHWLEAERQEIGRLEDESSE